MERGGKTDSPAAVLRRRPGAGPGAIGMDGASGRAGKDSFLFRAGPVHSRDIRPAGRVYCPACRFCLGLLWPGTPPRAPIFCLNRRTGLARGCAGGFAVRTRCLSAGGSQTGRQALRRGGCDGRLRRGHAGFLLAIAKTALAPVYRGQIPHLAHPFRRFPRPRPAGYCAAANKNGPGKSGAAASETPDKHT